jgi:uncharacterized protein (DUF3084 family)
MKNFITILLLVLASFVSYGQDSTEVQPPVVDTVQADSNYVSVKLDSLYPQPLVVDGEVIGVLFTVEQAQQIDNDYELFSLMDSIITQYGVNDSITVGVINAQGKKIASLEMQVENLNKTIANNEEMLSNRDVVIGELKDKIYLQEAQIKLYQQKETSFENEIADLKKEVKKQKRQKIFGFIGTGTMTIGIIVLSVLLGK